MILILLLLSSIASITYLLTTFTNNTMLIPVWILSGIIVTFLVLYIMVYLILLPIFTKLAPNNRFKHSVARQFMILISLFTRTSYKVVDKKKLVKRSNEPLVFVANHKCLIDGPWCYALLNRPLTVVAKDTLLKNKLYKPVMKAFHVVTIDRDNDRSAAKSIIAGTKLIKNGLPIMVFPEGGIKSRETCQMVSLRPGAYKLATRANATIQPIAIDGAINISKRKTIFKWTKVKITILDPIKYEEYKDLNTTELGLEIAKRVNATFNDKQVEVEVL